ncbi:GPR1/FUN34/yaaH family-domain-containing protein [Jimgerdemannia flammicorona]|uniref:GPR1/FUN34/yaaH family-domain-containing protein n=1 Tax=Jimgerdemannia flammicorona TaxID=994334 RepID=A0A433DDA4_9FUNG|nr:GPR1/FUN34/yaaH family-domain-containing protein [Jimgerdemannia flammicorona]
MNDKPIVESSSTLNNLAAIEMKGSCYSSQPVLPNQYAVRAGNPGPLGLFSFALVTFVLSVFNVVWPDAPNNALIVGGIFYGGIAQFIAGLLDFQHGNTFSATTFCSFGAFWTGQGFLMLPINFNAAYAGDTEMWAQGLAVYHLGWVLFTYMMFGASLKLKKGSVLLSILLFLVGTTMLMLAVNIWTGNTIPKRIAGVTGLLAAFGAWYAGLAEIVVEDGMTFPVGAHNTVVVHERV